MGLMKWWLKYLINLDYEEAGVYYYLKRILKYFRNVFKVFSKYIYFVLSCIIDIIHHSEFKHPIK